MALANHVEQAELREHALKVLELLDGLPIWAVERVLDLAAGCVRTGQRFDINSPEFKTFRESLKTGDWFIG